MKLHRPVLKLRRAKLRRDAQESGAAPLAALDDTVVAAPAQARKPDAGQPWMSAHELNAAGFEETLPTDLAQLVAHGWLAKDQIAPQGVALRYERGADDTTVTLTFDAAPR